MFLGPLGSFRSIQAVLSQGKIPFRTRTVDKLVTISTTTETAMVPTKACCGSCCRSAISCRKVPEDVPYCQDDHSTLRLQEEEEEEFHKLRPAHIIPSLTVIMTNWSVQAMLKRCG